MLETACLTEHTAEGNTAEGETVDLDGEQTNLGAAGPANSVVEYTVVDLEAEAAGMAALIWCSFNGWKSDSFFGRIVVGTDRLL